MLSQKNVIIGIKRKKYKIPIINKMKTHFDISELIESGSIKNELDYERALIADRKLRLLSKENAHFKTLRQKLRDIIERYENAEWNNVESISNEKIIESDDAERVAEAERSFIEKRKQEIRKRLKELDLSQTDLALLLGHRSKTHMSELINGIKPFTLKDLIIINRLLKVDITKLVPVYLSKEDQIKIKEAIRKLNKPKIELTTDDLTLA
jgi:hypothetical protein